MMSSTVGGLSACLFLADAQSAGGVPLGDDFGRVCRNQDIRPKFAYQRELRYNRFTALILPSMVCEVMAEHSVARLQLGVPRLPANNGKLPQPPLKFIGISGTRKPRVVIGIIDDGCAFAHPALTKDDGTPRVHFLWDQNPRDNPGPQWNPNLPFPYGWELRHDMMARYSCAARNSGDTSMAYRDVQYAPVTLGLDRQGTDLRDQPRDAMRTSTHGHGVMHLAAGIEGGCHPLDDQRALSAFDTAPPRDDHAAGWPIVFVQLPTRTTLDTSGGSLAVHALDALHYIISRAEQLPYDKDCADGAANGVPVRPPTAPGEIEEAEESIHSQNWIFVNLSYGAIAGPHDGSSILEHALAEVVGTPGRFCTIALAAGNSHRTRTHALLSLAEEGEAGVLKWSVGPDHPFESFLEIWLPGADVRACARTSIPAGNSTETGPPTAGGPQAEDLSRSGGIDMAERDRCSAAEQRHRQAPRVGAPLDARRDGATGRRCLHVLGQAGNRNSSGTTPHPCHAP